MDDDVETVRLQAIVPKPLLDELRKEFPAFADSQTQLTKAAFQEVLKLRELERTRAARESPDESYRDRLTDIDSTE